MNYGNLILAGIDHRAPIEIREKAAVKKDWPFVYAKALILEGVQEVVLLSTCHRTEVYSTIYGKSYNAEDIFTVLFPWEKDIWKKYLYKKEGEEVVRHLFRVACGLESIVIGEDQILGQVKEGWQRAQEIQACGKILNELFRRAVTIGKKFRETTGISHHSLSLSTIAIQAAKKIFGTLAGKKVVIIGTGEMAQLTIRNLIREEVGEILVFGRTEEKAEQIRTRFPQINVMPYEKKYSYVAQSDIVISATDAPHYTVYWEKFLPFYTGKTLCLIDLAVPRDIDPAMEKLPGIILFTVDRFQAIAQENERYRREIALHAEVMIEQAVQQFIEWYRTIPWMSLVNNFTSTIGEICEKELGCLSQKLSEREEYLVRTTLRRIQKKITNQCAMFLRSFLEKEVLKETHEWVNQNWESRQ